MSSSCNDLSSTSRVVTAESALTKENDNTYETETEPDEDSHVEPSGSPVSERGFWHRLNRNQATKRSGEPSRWLRTRHHQGGRHVNWNLTSPSDSERKSEVAMNRQLNAANQESIAITIDQDLAAIDGDEEDPSQEPQGTIMKDIETITDCSQEHSYNNDTTVAAAVDMDQAHKHNDPPNNCNYNQYDLRGISVIQRAQASGRQMSGKDNSFISSILPNRDSIRSFEQLWANTNSSEQRIHHRFTTHENTETNLAKIHQENHSSLSNPVNRNTNALEHWVGFGDTVPHRSTKGASFVDDDRYSIYRGHYRPGERSLKRCLFVLFVLAIVMMSGALIGSRMPEKVTEMSRSSSQDFLAMAENVTQVCESSSMETSSGRYMCQRLCHNHICCVVNETDTYSCRDDEEKMCAIYAGCSILLVEGVGTKDEVSPTSGNSSQMSVPPLPDWDTAVGHGVTLEPETVEEMAGANSEHIGSFGNHGSSFTTSDEGELDSTGSNENGMDAALFEGVVTKEEVDIACRSSSLQDRETCRGICASHMCCFDDDPVTSCQENESCSVYNSCIILSATSNDGDSVPPFRGQAPPEHCIRHSKPVEVFTKDWFDGQYDDCRKWEEDYSMAIVEYWAWYGAALEASSFQGKEEEQVQGVDNDAYGRMDDDNLIVDTESFNEDESNFFDISGNRTNVPLGVDGSSTGKSDGYQMENDESSAEIIKEPSSSLNTFDNSIITTSGGITKEDVDNACYNEGSSCQDVCTAHMCCFYDNPNTSCQQDESCAIYSSCAILTNKGDNESGSNAIPPFQGQSPPEHCIRHSKPVELFSESWTEFQYDDCRKWEEDYSMTIMEYWEWYGAALEGNDLLLEEEQQQNTGVNDAYGRMDDDILIVDTETVDEYELNVFHSNANQTIREFSE